MRCQRCRSAMVFEVYYGPGTKFSEWRCVVCGNVIDAYILANRLRQSSARKRPMLESQLRGWMVSQEPNRIPLPEELPAN
jgi:hypothetical protein